MLLLWPVLLLVAVNGQGSPDDGGGGGGPSEQEVALLFTSEMYVCEDDVSKSYINLDKCNTMRYNESMTYVTGKMEMLKPFDPNTVLEIILSKIANGKKETMFSMSMKLCEEVLKQEESDYYSLLQYLGLPSDCNIEEGSYDINNLEAKMDDLPINNSNMGDYEATMTFYKCENSDCSEKVFEACIKLDCAIEPV